MAAVVRYTRKIKAEKEIQSFLESTNKVVFHENELLEIIDSHRVPWALAATTPAQKLLTRFINNGIVQATELTFTNGRKQTLFLLDNPSPFDIAAGIQAKSYLSHYTAVYLHGLTEQEPKTIYVTTEQSKKNERDFTITQAAIDHAFAQPQRRSLLETTYEDYKFIFLNGKYTNRAGVREAYRTPEIKRFYSFTNLERTLIDITVRPNYAGGAFAVLQAYKAAILQSFSGNRLFALLEKMDFIYPYRQSIGFYLEKANYKGPWLAKLREIPKEFDFYLDYNIPKDELAYSSEWRIFYPKEM